MKLSFQLFLGTSMAALLACGGGGGASNSVQTPLPPATVWNTYALGYSTTAIAGPGVFDYMVYENGAQVLAMPSNCNPFAMSVAGTDVYVAGEVYDSTTSAEIPTIWKNGVVYTGLVPTSNILVTAVTSVEN